MSATFIQEHPSSTSKARRPAHQAPFTGRERVTVDNFWPDVLPFVYLAALTGIVVYLVSGI